MTKKKLIEMLNKAYSKCDELNDLLIDATSILKEDVTQLSAELQIILAEMPEHVDEIEEDKKEETEETLEKN